MFYSTLLCVDILNTDRFEPEDVSESTNSDVLGRRTFIRTIAGATAVAGATGTAAAQEGGGGNASGDGNESGGGGGGVSQTVQVAPGGQLVFEPEEIQIEPGGTVEWVWGSGGHNVAPQDSKDWGHQPLENEGFTWQHTFEEEGEYPYGCTPHVSAGMVASVIVGSGGGGGSQTVLPSSAKSIGVAATAAMLSTLGLAYFFMRYGGDYERPGE